MKRLTWMVLFLFGFLVASVGLAQQPGQPSTKPAKVYTNDDLPALRNQGGVYVTSTPSQSSTSKPSAPGGHGEKYYRTTYSKLVAQRDLHQRELDVLEKQLDENNIQFYSDPNKELQQQYSRSDIAKNQEEINAKKLQVEEDEQAISDLQDQLRRDGGEPSWLEAGPVSKESDVEPVVRPSEDKNLKDKKGTKDYWQPKFKLARANLAKAEEEQKLADDEMNFLKKRQVQELSAEAQAEINNKMPEDQSALDAANAKLDKARQALADLQKDFAESGAPEEWSVTE